MTTRTISYENPPAVLGTSTRLPPHRYDQDELLSLVRELAPSLGEQTKHLERFFARTGVNERSLALPAASYRSLAGLESRNRAWLEVATELTEEAVRSLLDRTGIPAEEIGQLASTTVTGLAVPSLEARLMNRLPFSPDLKRVPMFGLGCAGGAAGLARAADYLRAFPDQTAILLAVELCSLTVQPDDFSTANVVSMGLFGDGVAAVLLAGSDHRRAGEARPVVLDSRSSFFRDTERVMGWDFVDTGFKIVLSRDVPRIAREELPGAVRAFLAEHGLAEGDIATWITHPGGPKVMDAIEQGLDLPPHALEPARKGLSHHGNLSSASVLFLLDDFRRRQRPARGDYGLMIAMGPAFGAEMVLLQW